MTDINQEFKNSILFESLLSELQQTACVYIAQDLTTRLPLSIRDVSWAAKWFHISATFHEKGKPIMRGCNVDTNRWTCITENGQVISISLG